MHIQQKSSADKCSYKTRLLFEEKRHSKMVRGSDASVGHTGLCKNYQLIYSMLKENTIEAKFDPAVNERDSRLLQTIQF